MWKAIKLNSKINEPHNFVCNLSKRLYLGIWNKHVALQNLCVYYTWKNIRQQYKNNRLKIIAPTLNDEFEHCSLILLFIFTSTGLAIDY